MNLIQVVPTVNNVGGDIWELKVLVEVADLSSGKAAELMGREIVDLVQTYYDQGIETAQERARAPKAIEPTKPDHPADKLTRSKKQKKEDEDNKPPRYEVFELRTREIGYVDALVAETYWDQGYKQHERKWVRVPGSAFNEASERVSQLVRHDIGDGKYSEEVITIQSAHPRMLPADRVRICISRQQVVKTWAA